MNINIVLRNFIFRFNGETNGFDYSKSTDTLSVNLNSTNTTMSVEALPSIFDTPTDELFDRVFPKATPTPKSAPKSKSVAKAKASTSTGSDQYSFADKIGDISTASTVPSTQPPKARVGRPRKVAPTVPMQQSLFDHGAVAESEKQSTTDSTTDSPSRSHVSVPNTRRENAVSKVSVERVELGSDRSYSVASTLTPVKHDFSRYLSDKKRVITKRTPKTRKAENDVSKCLETPISDEELLTILSRCNASQPSRKQIIGMFIQVDRENYHLYSAYQHDTSALAQKYIWSLVDSGWITTRVERQNLLLTRRYIGQTFSITDLGRQKLIELLSNKK